MIQKLLKKHFEEREKMIEKLYSAMKLRNEDAYRINIEREKDDEESVELSQKYYQNRWKIVEMLRLILERLNEDMHYEQMEFATMEEITKCANRYKQRNMRAINKFESLFHENIREEETKLYQKAKEKLLKEQFEEIAEFIKETYLHLKLLSENSHRKIMESIKDNKDSAKLSKKYYQERHKILENFRLKMEALNERQYHEGMKSRPMKTVEDNEKYYPEGDEIIERSCDLLFKNIDEEKKLLKTI